MTLLDYFTVTIGFLNILMCMAFAGDGHGNWALVLSASMASYVLGTYVSSLRRSQEIKLLLERNRRFSGR